MLCCNSVCESKTLLGSKRRAIIPYWQKLNVKCLSSFTDERISEAQVLLLTNLPAAATLLEDTLSFPEISTEQVSLKALEVFGNCRKPVFSLGVSQQMHKVNLQNFWPCKNFGSIGHRSFMKIMKERPPSVCFQMHVKSFYLTEKLPLS